MTRTLINGFLLQLFFLSTLTADAQTKDLLLDWEFAVAGSDSWNKAEIPGNIFTDLMRINAIPDPFKGANEDSVQWVSKTEWIYRSGWFNVEPAMLEAKELFLRFSQLDAPCEIRLNGKLIIKADNAFRTWEAEVKKIALPQNNRLEIRFLSPVNEALIRAKKYGFLPSGEARVFVRKAPYQFGWDWGPALPGAGMGAVPQLHARNIFEVKQCAVHTLKVENDIATMELNMEISANENTGSSVTLRVEGMESDYGKVYLQKGTHIYSYIFSVKQPQLWWSHDQGKPHLYKYELLVKARGEEHVMQDRFGIRKIELITEKSLSSDSGSSFLFRLNGRDIFAKGANYIPQDIFPHRVSASQYKSLLEQAVESNMNMLRVWGGGIYEKEIFYDLCDSLGILIWQDYMFACAMYPGNKKFIDNVKYEAAEQSLRIGAHPCVALFCGNNEIAEGWARWGWKDPLKKLQINKLDAAYQAIFEEILRNTTAANTQCDYWPSSPMLGRGDPLHTSRGDAHYWGVWHDAEPFENFRIKVPRFMSEFGFQSYPSKKTLLQIDGNEDKLYAGSDVLANHQKHSRGDKLIAEYMSGWLDSPVDFDEFLYYSQFIQAEGMRIGIDAHLAAWPYCSGSLYWQYNDCWPAISWSSRDYYGNWKMMQYMVKDAFKPLRILVRPTNNNSIEVWIHNSTPEAHRLTLNVHFYDKDELYSSASDEVLEIYAEAGKNTLVAEFPVNRSPKSDEPHYWLFEILEDGFSDREIFPVGDFKSFTNYDNEVEVAVERNANIRQFTLKSRAFEKGVWLECSGSGIFSDNYFDLLPGEEKVVLFDSEELDLTFTLRSLRSKGLIYKLDEKDK